jgi:hypothetical protein
MLTILQAILAIGLLCSGSKPAQEVPSRAADPPIPHRPLR